MDAGRDKCSFRRGIDRYRGESSTKEGFLRTAIAAMLAATGMILFAQIRPSFEVASIKPSAEGSREGLTIQPGGRVVANGMSLKTLIGLAWRLRAFQVTGGERWMTEERWSIAAVSGDLREVPAWAPPDLPEVVASRLRTLLEDRFELRTHHETRDQRVYVLSIGKSGPKMAPVDVALQAGIRAGPGMIAGSGMTISQLVTLLERLLDRPVSDKTGLTGKFNIRLQFAPEGTDSPAPSLFTAVQEQLGLKLDLARETADVLTIDSAQRPTEN
jgi:uncharacterized protein (TIGR03435 family)